MTKSKPSVAKNIRSHVAKFNITKVKAAYLLVCLSWGFSWFAMKMQAQDGINQSISVGYRFVAAGMLICLICLATRIPLKVTRKALIYSFFIGILTCGCNQIMGYYSSNFIKTCIIAVVFASTIILNEAMSTLLNKTKLEIRVIIGGTVGMLGLLFVFYDQFSVSNKQETLIGISFIAIGSIAVSIGSVLSARVMKLEKCHFLALTFYTTVFGGCVSLLLGFLTGGNLNIANASIQYYSGLLYSILIATVIGVSCSFYLTKEIGPGRAATTSLVYPIIALVVSSYYEGFSFSAINIIGIVIVGLGQYFVGMKQAKLKLVK